MSLIDDKEKPLKLLSDTSDELKIKNILEILDDSSDWWDSLPQAIIDEVNESQKELKAGKGVSHQEALNQIKRFTAITK